MKGVCGGVKAGLTRGGGATTDEGSAGLWLWSSLKSETVRWGLGACMGWKAGEACAGKSGIAGGCEGGVSGMDALCYYYMKVGVVGIGENGRIGK